MDDQAIIDRAIKLLQARLKRSGIELCAPNDVVNYLTLKLAELEYESFQVLFLDSQNRLIESEELFKGTVDAAAVYPREVVKAALQFNAAAVILAHNHPSGVSQPSQADKQITERLKAALALVGTRTLDHIVIGGDKPYSFAENYLL